MLFRCLCDVHLSESKYEGALAIVSIGPHFECQGHDEKDGRQHATYDREEVSLSGWFVVDTAGLLLRPPQDTR